MNIKRSNTRKAVPNQWSIKTSIIGYLPEWRTRMLPPLLLQQRGLGVKWLCPKEHSVPLQYPWNLTTHNRSTIVQPRMNGIYMKCLSFRVALHYMVCPYCTDLPVNAQMYTHKRIQNKVGCSRTSWVGVSLENYCFLYIPNHQQQCRWKMTSGVTGVFLWFSLSRSCTGISSEISTQRQYYSSFNPLDTPNIKYQHSIGLMKIKEEGVALQGYSHYR